MAELVDNIIGPGVPGVNVLDGDATIARVSRYRAVEDLDEVDRRFYTQFIVPRAGADGRDYVDLAEIDERLGCDR